MPCGRIQLLVDAKGHYWKDTATGKVSQSFDCAEEAAMALSEGLVVWLEEEKRQ
jgi:hypothetical protein